MKAGTYRPGATSRMTLNELADVWEAQKTRDGMRTLSDARSCYDNHGSTTTQGATSSF